MKNNKLIRPDEYFNHGPLEITRFGDKTFYQSNLEKDQIEELHNNLANEFDGVVSQIDILVEKIALKVSDLPADALLYRAWMEMSAHHMGMKSEVEASTDDVGSVRMLDYLQSVIVSVEPNSVLKADISEEDWDFLKNHVDELFNLINLKYHICHTAKKKIAEPSLNMNEEEFYFKSQMYWCNVRGERYHCHNEEHFSDLLLVHTEVLETNFDISAKDLISELMKIQYSLTKGMPDAVKEIMDFREKTLSALEIKMKEGSQSENGGSFGDLLQLVVKENGWTQWQNDIFGKFQGLDLFDLSKVTNIPEKLLSSLSWERGEDKEFFAEGEFKGWPLRIWPVFKKPFIKLNGNYYCFDLNSLFDNLYRVIQRTIFVNAPEYKSEWNKKQKNISEELPFKYLSKLLPNSTEFRSVYYRSGVGKKGRMEWCEADGLIIYDDHLFIIEVKAGAFTYTSPANDLPAYIKSIKGLVLSPSLQAKRFMDYLLSEEEVSIYDDNHQQISTLAHSDFRKITICPITIDSFTEIAAQIQHLKGIGIDVGDTPTWSMSIDDLRVYSEVFTNPLIFLHFVEQRMNSFSSNVIESNDELDHLGLYMKHNNYTLYANELREQPETNIMFSGYRLDVDTYFADKLTSPDLVSPIVQDMPNRLMEIIEILSSSYKKGRTKISSYLLDCDDEFRKTVISNVDSVLKKQPSLQRPLPLSTYGDTKLTVFCWQEADFARDEDVVLDHSRAAMLVTDDHERLVIELFYSDIGVLEKVEWKEISLQGLSNSEIERLKEKAKTLKGGRHNKVGKIGRNEPCSCGSGEKFKKCCRDLNR